jgi:hypothetical protein
MTDGVAECGREPADHPHLVDQCLSAATPVMILTLHVGFAVVSAILILMGSYFIAVLVAPAVPFDARYVLAGVASALAVGAGMGAPAVLQRIVRTGAVRSLASRSAELAARSASALSRH